jgi:hypothetical protein
MHIDVGVGVGLVSVVCAWCGCISAEQYDRVV